MKNELTLKELQDFSLTILEDVHAFCVAHDIRYSLAYGTLIGAIRHKGFIPWDDDIDIIMPRPDYDKFKNLYKSEKFMFSCTDTDKDCLLSFGRVFDTQKTIIQTEIPWHKKKYGVWIDVFPVDAVDDDFDCFVHSIKRNSTLLMGLQYSRRAMMPVSLQITFSHKFKQLLRRVIFVNGLFTRFYVLLINKRAKKLKYGSTNHWGLLAFNSYKEKDYHDSSLFSDVKLVDFEDKQFYALVGYDTYLRHLYGDYMQLPPIDQQKPKQSYLRFYWK